MFLMTLKQNGRNMKMLTEEMVKRLKYFERINKIDEVNF